MNTPKSFPEITLEHKLVKERLEKAAIFELVSYGELTEIMGRNAQGTGRGIISSVRRELLNDHGILFVPIYKVGLRRAGTEEVFASGKATFIKILRATKRSARALAGLEYQGLSGEQKAKHNALATQLAVLSEFSGGRTTKRIESIVAVNDAALTVGNTLKFFSGEKQL